MDADDERRLDDFTVLAKDGRELRFRGTLIGYATSYRSGKERWSEISIHRTEAGSYIVSGIGRSVKTGEVDKHWASLSESPDGAIETLHLLDDFKTRYMPGPNRRALEEAMERDPALAEAYSVERIA